MSDDQPGADEALIQFLYSAPIGLLQTRLNGEIELLNPKSSQLLMPLSRDGGLDNLFTLLEEGAPQLRALCAQYAPASGVICEGLRLEVASRQPGRPDAPAPQYLSLGLMRVGPDRLMAVVDDIGGQVLRERRMLAQSLASASHTDTLTRLPNRLAMLARLERLLPSADDAGAAPYAVLFINIDRFAQINNAHGPALGDQVIGLLAERLRSTLRSRPRDGGEGDPATMAVRLGGDEFAVLLEDVAHGGAAQQVARRLLAALNKPYRIGALDVPGAVSIGVLSSAHASGAADAVLRDAGIAMTAAKAAGGAQAVLFEPAMRERAAWRASVEAELRTALAQGHLAVVYQPVVGFAADGTLDRALGVEALVRWLHPVRGVVGPVEFIPVAEECGLIDALGMFVLSTACRDFMAWRAQLGAAAPRLLAVNLSRAQLFVPDLVAQVRRVLDETGMPPGQLQFEVTESMAAQGTDIRTCLHALKGLGIQLALDDFGTGYSSLSSLHLLPVDTVKIDRSFVSQSDTSLHHQVLIEATVKVAQSLGMSTVAEGIETASQSDLVRAMGCDKGQGYLFSKPLASAALLDWLAATPVAMPFPCVPA